MNGNFTLIFLYFKTYIFECWSITFEFVSVVFLLQTQIKHVSSNHHVVKESVLLLYYS